MCLNIKLLVLCLFQSLTIVNAHKIFNFKVGYNYGNLHKLKNILIR